MKGSKQSPSGKDTCSVLAAKGIKGGVESVRTGFLLNSFLHPFAHTSILIQIYLSHKRTQVHPSSVTSICRTPLSTPLVQPLLFLPVTFNLSSSPYHNTSFSPPCLLLTATTYPLLFQLTCPRSRVTTRPRSTMPIAACLSHLLKLQRASPHRVSPPTSHQRPQAAMQVAQASTNLTELRLGLI